MRIAGAVLVLALALLAAASRAPAIVGGGPDGSAHPEVGAVLVPRRSRTGRALSARARSSRRPCSSPPRTATMGIDPVEVTFGWPSRTEAPPTPALPRRPAYRKTQSDPHDLAVIVLDKPVRPSTPARPAEAGSLDCWPTGPQQFTSVGYGAQEVTARAGRAHVPLQRRPRRGDRDAQLGHPRLAPRLDEPVPRQRRHLLRRLRRPELPRRTEQRARGDDDHGRRDLPLDQRRLPARHASARKFLGQFVALP